MRKKNGNTKGEKLATIDPPELGAAELHAVQGGYLHDHANCLSQFGFFPCDGAWKEKWG